MNAPLRRREDHAGIGTLDLFAFFHLNLAFSSIEEEQRGDVISRCYWPLLVLCEAHGPIGIEATGLRWKKSPRVIPNGSAKRVR